LSLVEKQEGNYMKKVVSVCLALVAMLAVSAGAGVYDPFKPFDISGIVVSPSSIPAVPPTYTVSLASGAVLNYGGNDYTIDNIIGFYVVGNVTGTPIVSGWWYDVNGQKWKWSDVGPGDGWKSNGSSGGIHVGDTPVQFKFASLSVIVPPPPVFGYHLGLKLDGKADPFGGNTTTNISTGFVYSDGGGPVPNHDVPEASAVALGALGLLGPMGYALKRKRVSN